MNYKKLYIYLVSFISGIFINKYLISILIPLFLGLFVLQYNFLLILFFLASGYFLYKFLLPATMMLCVGSGIVDYKTDKFIYLTHVQLREYNQNKLRLKHKDVNVNIGDKIKFHFFYINNGYGKLTKIVYKKPQTITYMQKLRISIDNFFKQSKFYFFLKAIIIGDRSYFNSEDINKLKISGFWHLVAISGLHMNIVIISIFKFLKRLFAHSFHISYKTNSRMIAAVISILFGIFYTSISLYSITATRALIMTSSFLCFGGMLDSKKILIFTAFLMIVYNPLIVFDMSFQLSFLCTWILINKWPMILLNISILPILQQFNIISLLTNFIVLPLFSLILILSFIAFCLHIHVLLNIIDFLCFAMFKVIYFPSLLISCKFNIVSTFLYIILFNLSILKNQSRYIVIGFFSIFIISYFCQIFFQL